jgi:hypothetical protein
MEERKDSHFFCIWPFQCVQRAPKFGVGRKLANTVGGAKKGKANFDVKMEMWPSTGERKEGIKRGHFSTNSI